MEAEALNKWYSVEHLVMMTLWRYRYCGYWWSTDWMPIEHIFFAVGVHAYRAVLWSSWLSIHEIVIYFNLWIMVSVHIIFPFTYHWCYPKLATRCTVVDMNQQLTTSGECNIGFAVSKSVCDSSHLLGICSFVWFITQQYLHTCTKL